MKTQNAVTVNLFARQVTGFARWQVENAMAQTGMDFRAAYFGTEISDKLFTGLRERHGKLAMGKGSKAAVLIVHGGFGLYGFNVQVSGDTYSRVYGTQTVVGSLELLRAVYGKGNVQLGSEKEFLKLAEKKKVHRDSDIKAAKKVKAKKAKEEGEEESEE